MALSDGIYFNCRGGINCHNQWIGNGIKSMWYTTDDIHNDFGRISYPIQVYLDLILDSHFETINLN